MTFRDLFGTCFWFGHDDPIKVIKGKVFVFVCPRCLTETHQPLKGNKPKYRKEKSLRVIKMKQRSA